MKFLSRILIAVLAMSLASATQGQTPPPAPAPAPAKDTQPPAPAAPATPSTAQTPPVANPAIKQAVEELNKGNAEEALKILKKARDTDKGMENPQVIIARLLYNTGDNNNIVAARRLLEQTSAEDPDDVDCYLLSAEFAQREGRIIDAMLSFEQALRKSDQARWHTEQKQRFYKTSRLGLAQVYSQRNERQKAVDQIVAILKEDEKNAFMRLQYAGMLFLSNPEMTFEELKKAYADDSKNPRIGLPELNMAKMWDSKQPAKETAKADEKKNKETAEEWFKKALAAWPKEVQAPRDYALWLLNQGRLDEAAAKLADAKRIDPNDNETSFVLGLLHRAKKEYAQAEAVFTALTQNDSDNLAYAFNLYLSMAEIEDAKKRENAIKRADQVRLLQQRNPQAFAVLSWCLYKAGRYEEAERAILTAMQLGGGRATLDGAYYYACIFDKRGKGKEARDMLAKAMENTSWFMYRTEAEKLLGELIAKHGPPTKDEKKVDPKPEEKKP